MWNIPLHHVNNCHCDRVNKEADWPIAEQVEVRRDSQEKEESQSSKQMQSSKEAADELAIQRKGA